MGINGMVTLGAKDSNISNFATHDNYNPCPRKNPLFAPGATFAHTAAGRLCRQNPRATEKRFPACGEDKLMHILHTLKGKIEAL